MTSNPDVRPRNMGTASRDDAVSVSRRVAMNMMVSASAVAAGAAPTLATEIPVDPIFAAIDACHSAWREVEAAIEANGALEDSLGDDDAVRDHGRIQGGTYKDEDGNVK